MPIISDRVNKYMKAQNDITYHQKKVGFDSCGFCGIGFSHFHKKGSLPKEFTKINSVQVGETPKCNCQYEEGHSLKCPLYVETKFSMSGISNNSKAPKWEDRYDENYAIQGKEGSIAIKNENERIKSFISNLLAEEKDKWQKEQSAEPIENVWQREKEEDDETEDRIRREQSGGAELKLCPSCKTIKVFSTEVCVRCLDKILKQ